MTEVLSRGREYDPFLNYSTENYPPIDEQQAFFHYALLEAEEVEPAKLMRGPHASHFVDIMQRSEERIKGIDPSFTPEHTMPFGYQSQEVRSQLFGVDREIRCQLEAAANMRREEIHELVGTELQQAFSEQEIPVGLLDIPYYTQQSEDWIGSDAIRGCSNACFRMVFGAISGWLPSQTAVSENLMERYGTAVVDDSTYSSLYQTEIFSEICDKSVATYELIGADLAVIEKITTKLKKKRPSAEVYCTVNLASETAGEAVWHTCVLLSAENGVVVHHDPSNYNGGAYKSIPLEQFVSRWALAYNRAVLTIAA